MNTELDVAALIDIQHRFENIYKIRPKLKTHEREQLLRDLKKLIDFADQLLGPFRERYFDVLTQMENEQKAMLAEMAKQGKPRADELIDERYPKEKEL